MPKGTNRTTKIKEAIAKLFIEQSGWDSKRLRKSCLDTLGSDDAKERARLGNSIRRTLTHLLEAQILVMGESDEILPGPAFSLLKGQGIETEDSIQKTNLKKEKSESTPTKEPQAKKPKEKDMRLFLAEFLQGGVHTEEEIVRAAVERFMVQGERIHGVRGLALQILKALEAEGALFFSDGIYRSATSSTVTVKPVAVEKIPETKRKTAVKVQKATKVKARSPQLLAAGRAVLDEKKFSALLNEQGGAYFNVFVAKLLESYYASVGVRVSGRFVVDGSEDKGIDVVFHTRDELGISDKVAVQAKTRARSQITLKELREFYGCVHAEGATKGIFITTATFTTEAVEFLHRSVDLAGIDSAKLFELASRFEIGICHRDGKPYPAPELTV